VVNWRIFLPAIVIVLIGGAVIISARQHSSNPLSLSYDSSTRPTPTTTPQTSDASTSTTPATVAANPKTTTADSVASTILQQALTAGDTTQVDTTTVLGDESSASTVNSDLNANQNGL